MKKLFWFAVVVAIIFALAGCESEPTTPAEAVLVTEPAAPSANDYAAYLVERLPDLEVPSSILVEPVELVVSRYDLGKKDIAVHAVVQEAAVGAQDGKMVTRQVVAWTLDFLVENGFDPAAEYIMPICSVRRYEDMDGQRMVRIWGRSMYNPYTGNIDWKEGS